MTISKERVSEREREKLTYSYIVKWFVDIEATNADCQLKPSNCLLRTDPLLWECLFTFHYITIPYRYMNMSLLTLQKLYICASVFNIHMVYVFRNFYYNYLTMIFFFFFFFFFYNKRKIKYKIQNEKKKFKNNIQKT